MIRFGEKKTRRDTYFKCYRTPKHRIRKRIRQSEKAKWAGNFDEENLDSSPFIMKVKIPILFLSNHICRK